MHRLLEHMIVCVNLQSLLEDDVKKIVKDTRKFFVDEGFKIQEEYRPTPDQKVVKLFTYAKDNVTIIVTKDAIEMSVNAMEKYEGFDTYKTYVTNLLNAIEKDVDDVDSIIRVGVRKINTLFVKDTDLIGKYFDESIFNVSKMNVALGENGGKVLTSGTRLSLVNDTNKLNVITDIQLGEGKMVKDGHEENIDIYRIVLDLDAYWDKSLIPYESVESKLNELSRKATDIYTDCLDSNFVAMLLDGKINDDNIIGGIKA